MSLLVLGVSLGTLLFGMVAVVFVIRRRPRRRNLKPDKFMQKWQELQKFCRKKDTWADALLEADKLLDKALKKRRFKGKSMGERLVAAQRLITDNDDIWDAHNLVKKIVAADGELPLKEGQVKEALISFKLALVDLGALPNARRKNTQ